MGRAPSPKSFLLCLALSLVGLSCDSKKNEPPPRPGAMGAAAPSPTPPAPVAPVWPAGAWTATVTTTAQPGPIQADIDARTLVDAARKKGAPPKQDAASKEPSTQPEGRQLTLELALDDNHQATGALTQPSSTVALKVTGAFSMDALRLRITGESARGVLVAKKEDDAFVGTLRLSEGDSSLVETASVRLTRSP